MTQLQNGLYPHQVYGIKFLTQHGRAILADDMSLGRLRVNIMKQIAHIDKKWQSSVTAYVEVTYEDGSHKYYLEGRYGGGTLTAEAYALAKPYQPTAWKRYRHLAGRPGIEVKIIDPNVHLSVVNSDVPAIKEEMQ